jgi:nucleoside-diphosphate-sugar epimerase
VLGWTPQVPFAEGLKRTVAWYKSERTAGRR